MNDFFSGFRFAYYESGRVECPSWHLDRHIEVQISRVTFFSLLWFTSETRHFQQVAVYIACSYVDIS